MKTFLITYTIMDGEHEYTQHNLIEGSTEKASRSNSVKILKKGGYRYDDREYELENIRELTEEELDFLKKFIFYF